MWHNIMGSLSAVPYRPWLSFVGLLTTISLAARVADFADLYLLRRSKITRYLHRDAEGRPAWALVTGASDGIGRHLVLLLAGHGFNVVLHGRNPAKLAKVEAEMRRKYPAREFRVLVVDAGGVPCTNCFAASSSSSSSLSPSSAASAINFDAIAESLSDLHLTVLINNAGGVTAPIRFDPLDSLGPHAVAANISTNALFPLHLAMRLMPALVRAGPSLVINVGSMADLGVPLVASYAASKSFLMTLTRSLFAEAMMGEGGRDKVEFLGIRVGLCTGTAYQDSTPSVFAPDSAVMARAVLDRVGCGRPVVVGYHWHFLQQIASDIMPEWIRIRLASVAMRAQRDDAKRWL